jgi:predicted nuclease of restriction endonuclease-like (RecB) superfamily
MSARAKAITKKSMDIKNYAMFLEQLKKRVRDAQIKAAVSVNTELIKLYWDIGKDILEKQEKEGWGSQIIERLGTDLQNEFPGIQGFSRSNVFKMRAFYLAYEKVSQAVRQLEDLPIARIPWGHNILIITKTKDINERLWYAQQTIENGLSRHALENWIATKAYKRHGKALTNFKDRLPDPQSRLAQETLKDPYNFDFLTLEDEYREQELELGLVGHIQKLLLELGKGFAFIGRQYHMEVGGNDYYLDLLFYNLNLRCYCVIELKATDFKPEYAGKLNFYLSVVDAQLKKDTDNPTIGILLCKTRNKLVVEYALQDINKPMGVAEYTVKLMEKLPKKLQSSLPTIEDIELELLTRKRKTAGTKKAKKKHTT